MVYNWKLIAAVALLVLYSGFSTYKWISTSVSEPLKCDNSALQTRIDDLEASNTRYAEDLKAAQELAAKQVGKGNQVRTETRTVFVPIKEKVNEIVAPAGCTGAFEPRVQDGFREAVDAANAAGELRTAGD